VTRLKPSSVSNVRPNGDTTEGNEMVDRIKNNRVVLRDLIIFQLKLLLDGLGDVVIAHVALVAVILDLLFPTERKGKRFYAVMARAERFDHWLSLYGSAEAADLEEDGLFGASQAGSDTLLGRLEEIVTGRIEVDRDSKAPKRPA
jgi:hypothetical protein